VSETHLETISSAEPFEVAPSRPRTWSRWLKWILLVLISLWLIAEGISLLIQHTRLRTELTARLAAAFGRSVEVGRYDLSVWGGPMLEARSVTVGEDPRFGHEYFLRAESMAVRLRWRSLLRGHLQLGTLSLTRPSLNLVRNAEGDWNVAEWLPRPVTVAGPSAFMGPQVPASLVPRFGRIEVNGGRINFKLADEKLPFAFVDVNGAIETDSPGSWRMDLTAAPFRPAVLMQRAGTLRVSGHVGGTSSRLRPAALDVSWTDASLPDALRLVHGDDLGLRGTFSLGMTARTQDHGDDWAIQSRVDLSQIRRWDLAIRPDNPSLSLISQLNLNPRASSLELTDATAKAPRSEIHASGHVYWNHALPIKGQESSPVQFNISSSKVDLADLLAWARAFRPGIADDVSVRGLAAMRATVFGGPLRVADAVILSQGAVISGPALGAPVHLGQVQFRFDHGIISFLPVTLSWTSPAGQPAGTLRIDLSTKRASRALPVWHVVGSGSQVRDLTVAASAFGSNVFRGWDLAGPFACDLRWQGSPLPLHSMPVGSIELGGSAGASIHAPFLNRPVEQIKARVDLKPGASHVKL
jgi:hypothetical protein